MSVSNYSVAVFAYNEAERIESCLKSICDQNVELPGVVTVLANGCKDDTVSVAVNFGKTHPNVQVAEIPFGSKTNAWNIFVHKIWPESGPAIFVDGDVKIEKGAFEALIEELEANPDVHCVAGLPVTGRNCKSLRKKLTERRGVIGCLYACSEGFLAGCRKYSVRLPAGAIPDDYLVQRIAKADLTGTKVVDENRVIPCERGGFSFESLSLWKARDYLNYYQRRISYSKAHFHARCIGAIASARGFHRLPRTIGEVLDEAKGHIKLKWRGLNTFFDLIAFRQLMRPRKIMPVDQIENFELRQS